MKTKDSARTLGVLCCAMALSLGLSALGIEAGCLLMVFMIAVMCCSALTHGYLYSLVSAVAGMLLYNYFFTEPLLTFAISDKQDSVLLAAFLITAFLSAGLTCRLRQALQQSEENAARAAALAAEKNRALLEAERAHTKSNLLRSIGHDLRTPLTGLQGGSSYLAEHAESMPRTEIARMAGDLYSQSTRLITLVENILYMTRIGNDHLEVKCQDEVVDDVVGEAVACVPQLKERQLRICLPDSVETVPMDGKMIVQVLVNLLDNAAKHTVPGAPITLSAGRQGARMVFCVEDGGNGIVPALRAHIFESFVTSGKIGLDGRRGVGLGLAICRAVVAAHGGEIGVDSSPLGGARFTFWLPTQEEST